MFEQLQEIKEALQGESLFRVARITGITRPTLYKVMRGAVDELPVRMSTVNRLIEWNENRKKSLEIIAQAELLEQQARDLRQAAEVVACSPIDHNQNK